MRVEVAVVKMLEAARDTRTSPETLARIFDLTMTKVAGINPNGQAALKLVHSKMLQHAIEKPMTIKRGRRPNVMKSENRGV